eukprot:3434668-Rhodomonas_salina.1
MLQPPVELADVQLAVACRLESQRDCLLIILDKIGVDVFRHSLVPEQDTEADLDCWHQPWH